MREEEGKTGRQGLGIEEGDPRNQPLEAQTLPAFFSYSAVIMVIFILVFLMFKYTSLF